MPPKGPENKSRENQNQERSLEKQRPRESKQRQMDSGGFLNDLGVRPIGGKWLDTCMHTYIHTYKGKEKGINYKRCKVYSFLISAIIYSLFIPKCQYLKILFDSLYSKNRSCRVKFVLGKNERQEIQALDNTVFMWEPDYLGNTYSMRLAESWMVHGAANQCPTLVFQSRLQLAVEPYVLKGSHVCLHAFQYNPYVPCSIERR